MQLQNIYLAFVTGLYRVTDEDSVPEIAQYGPFHLPLKGFTGSNGSLINILLTGVLSLRKQAASLLNFYSLSSEICLFNFANKHETTMSLVLIVLFLDFMNAFILTVSYTICVTSKVNDSLCADT